MFQAIGTTEWLVVIFIAVLFLFGGKKIPQFFKGLADAIKEFKKASTDSEEKEKES